MKKITKSIELKVRVFYKEESDRIAIMIKDDNDKVIWSGVNKNKRSKRYHPHMFEKLNNLLRESGKPYSNKDIPQ